MNPTLTHLARIALVVLALVLVFWHLDSQATGPCLRDDGSVGQYRGVLGCI